MSQQELLSVPPPLHHTSLLAKNSPLQAWYDVSIFQMIGFGYLIRKSSGCKNRRSQIETWYRPDYVSALKKYQQLIKAKTRANKTGRKYKQEEL